MAALVSVALALVLPRLVVGCDSSYAFPNTTEGGAPLSDADPLVRIEAGLQWQQFPKNGSVYMAMAFSVGKQEERQGLPGRECSSGYMRLGCLSEPFAPSFLVTENSLGTIATGALPLCAE